MAIEERIKKALEDEEKKKGDSESFKNLRDFYNQMKDGGFVVQQDYSLPPIDTVGRTRFVAAQDAEKKQ
jgi:hypothetical protein